MGAEELIVRNGVHSTGTTKREVIEGGNPQTLVLSRISYLE